MRFHTIDAQMTEVKEQARAFHARYADAGALTPAMHNDYIRELGLLARHQLRVERKYVRAMKRAALIERAARSVARVFGW